MSSSNCCVLSCLQVSQEADNVGWYFHLIKNILQFVVIHTVKGFSIVSETEVDVFLEFPCFFYNPVDVGTLISGFSAFLNPACTFGSSQFTYCWSLAWKILSIILMSCEMSAIVWWFKHSLALPFLGIGMKTGLFQSRGHYWVLQICWHIEYSTLTTSSSRIWNSSAGIPSPTLVLFIVMLPKAHLTSLSRMSDSKWVTIPSWLFGSLRTVSTVLLCILATFP